MVSEYKYKLAGDAIEINDAEERNMLKQASGYISERSR